MRILFTTWAWPTHYLPMVPLAWAARAAGHDVRVASQPGLRQVIARSGMTATLVGHDVDVAGPFLRDIASVLERDWKSITPEEIQRVGERATGLFFDVAESMVDDLVAFARAWRPDVVVYDPLTYAGPIAAAVLGVPAVRHLFGPDQPPTEFEGAWLRPLLARFDLAAVNTLGDLTIDPCPPSVQVPAELPRRPVRYVPYNGPGTVPRWLCEPPARRRICVSWGTSTVHFCGPHHYLARDMVAAARELAAEVVVTVTAADRELLGDLPPDVRVCEDLPLHLLLPTCDAIVHQGGAGTLLTAATSAVPQLVVPSLPDQLLNITQLARQGSGALVLRKGRPMPAVRDEVTATLAGLLREPGHKAAAVELSREMAGLPPPARAVTFLQELREALR